MIEGSYDLGGERLHTYNRIVIPPPDHGQPASVSATWSSSSVTSLADDRPLRGRAAARSEASSTDSVRRRPSDD